MAERAAGPAPRVGPFTASVYSDANVKIRYPAWWHRSESTWPELVLSDNTKSTGAYLSLRYLPRRTWTTPEGFAPVAGRLLRPPDGKGLTLRYTQAAVVGGRRGQEAAFIWQYRLDTPLGPRMRTFAIDLPSGQTAFLVLAAESWSAHDTEFSWVKKLIEWSGTGPAGSGPPDGL